MGLKKNIKSLVQSKGSFAMNGSASAKYINVTGTDYKDDNGLSNNSTISFNGSGEMDNGMSVSTSVGLQSMTSGQYSSTALTFGMGDAGTLTFAGTGMSQLVGVASDGLGDDEAVPTAFIETWDNLTPTGGVKSNVFETNDGAGNSIMYKSPSIGGVSFSLSYATETVEVQIADGTSKGNISSEGYYVGVSPFDGLTIGYGTGENTYTDSKNPKTNGGTDSETLFATYAIGPVTIGYQTTEYDNADSSSYEAMEAEVDSFAIGFAVNDNLSISYGGSTVDFAADGSGTVASTPDQESTAIGVSYTMGSMSIKANTTSTDNMSGSNDSSTVTELALTFAF
uniref:Porin domain-containing protein n=1 Tax=viral metagenome TaxID=1070528 RepID=A0A6C0IVQ9_9ZZZZ